MSVKKPQTRWILAAAVMSVVCAGIRAQQVGTIRGVVTDGDFDVPLGGVEVSVAGREDKATTTEQGNYSLPNLPAGSYTLVFAKDGYVRVIKPDVAVLAGRLTDLDVALTGDFTDMEEYVVEDVLQLGGSTEGDLLQLRFESPAVMDAVGADLMSKAGTSDAASALRLVAGASVQDGKSAVIRGLPDRYVSSQINGVRVPTADENKRAVELDQFPREVIESLQVRKTFTPDQQGDASGGAVNIVLKGVPKDTFFFRSSGQFSNNSQYTGQSDFLAYEGGGPHWDAQLHGDRQIQNENIGENWDGAVGSTRQAAPMDMRFSTAIGGSFQLTDGVRAGGLVSAYYKRDNSFYKNGINDKYWRGFPNEPLTPQVTGDSGDFTTALFDETKSSQTVGWGLLATAGIESENHSINLVYLETQTATDTAILSEDTRGKYYFFPGYDPENFQSPGFQEAGEAPFLRLETLNYIERSTDTLQLAGHHRFDTRTLFSPEIDWTLAKSSARSTEPDKRQFGSRWRPGITFMGQQLTDPVYAPFKPAANFTLGALQRIFKSIKEESEQGQIAIKLPFEVWDGEKGYFKFGAFYDETDREFNQDTFSNLADNETSVGPWEIPWSVAFPYENHPIQEATTDIDYSGSQRLAATFAMIDVPILPLVNLVGGMRWENTSISITNDPEADATWYPPNGGNSEELEGNEADVSYHQENALPAISLIVRPLTGVTLRASYAETLAKQTFKELSPILQQEFLGGPIFIGNPELRQSELQNYDVRVDWTPYEGGLFSASYFKKDIEGPIEYVQRVTSSFDYTTALNYPEGRLEGWEFETRQALGWFWGALEGLEVGANATLIDSKVRLTDDEIAEFADPLVDVGIVTRPMTNAPEHLYNLFLTYDIAPTRTQIGVFYTLQGDTLVAGAGVSESRFFVPSVYLVENDRLNLSISQAVGENTFLKFQAKNLTDPDQRTVYRSAATGPDITKTNYKNGLEFSLSLTGEVRF